MSRDLSLLRPDFRSAVEDLIARAGGHGLSLVPFSTLRTADEQACIWRSTRGKPEIALNLARLRGAGADYVADIIERVGPQYPPVGTRGHLTHAVPGQSWHNFGLAVDLYVKGPGGRPIWSDDKTTAPDEMKSYATMAEIARGLDLEAGWFWRFRDPVHVQFHKPSPLDLYGGWPDLCRRLKEMEAP